MKTLAGTVAYRNPRGAAKFMQKYGVKASPNPAVNEMHMNMIVSKLQTDQVIDDLMEEHPDREALAGSGVNHDYSRSVSQNQQPLPRQKHHNCCGSSNFDGEAWSGCTGCGGSCGTKQPAQPLHFAADGSGATAPTVQTGVSNTMIMGMVAFVIVFGLVVVATRTKG